jgi:CheY-like chemotaxis protein
MMGGDVNVSSVSGEGSVFTIKLPAIVSEPKNEGPIEIERAEAVGTSFQEGSAEGGETLLPVGRCVLVIDDDPNHRDLIQRFLSKEGFIVRTAGKGETGLRLARQLRPLAITLDVMMPGMDGWAVLTALKADRDLRDIPVIMLSMVDDPERGLALGAAEFATKPVDYARLSLILKKYISPSPPSRILLVEDDPASREITRTFLQKEGWQVIEAENGRGALGCMKRERPLLIVLDLLMPEMDGFEFAARLRQKLEWRSIPILVLTSHDVSPEERRRLNGLIETMLQKTGEWREGLLQQIRNLLPDQSVPRGVILPVREKEPATSI